MILGDPTVIKVPEIRSHANQVLIQSWNPKEKCGESQWMNVF